MNVSSAGESGTGRVIVPMSDEEDTTADAAAAAIGARLGGGMWIL